MTLTTNREVLLYEIFKTELTALREGQCQAANRIAESHQVSTDLKIKKSRKYSFGRLNVSKMKSLTIILAASLISLSVFAAEPPTIQSA